MEIGATDAIASGPPSLTRVRIMSDYSLLYNEFQNRDAAILITQSREGLMLRLHLYDDTTNPVRRFACTHNNQPGIIWTRVASRQDVINEIARVGVGRQLAELWLHLHGSPGIVQIQNGIMQSVAFDANNVHLLRNACFNAMAAYTWVYWLCGNLGEGPAGDAFLRAAGPAMLGGGGIMFASTSVFYSPPPIAGWAKGREANISSGGAVAINTGSYVVSW